MTREEKFRYDRDKMIIDDYKNKFLSIYKLSKKYKLSAERIRQIIKRDEPDSYNKPSFMVYLEKFTKPNNARKIYISLYNDVMNKNRERPDIELSKGEFLVIYYTCQKSDFLKIEGIGDKFSDILCEVSKNNIVLY